MSEDQNKDSLCPPCGGSMEEGGQATQVYRRSGSVITVIGIPAVRVCPRCQNPTLTIVEPRALAKRVDFAWWGIRHYRRYTVLPPNFRVLLDDPLLTRIGIEGEDPGHFRCRCFVGRGSYTVVDVETSSLGVRRDVVLWR
jgi:YgiT-type zinc finger domain-containing protein